MAGGFAGTIRGPLPQTALHIRFRVYDLGILRLRNCHPETEVPVISFAHHTIAVAPLEA